MSDAPNQTLPSKEHAMFKKLMKSCEQKQYKNGLKLVKQILSNSKCAEHGETIAMKGLIYSCIGKKGEARELVKQGLLFNLKSHVCWHVSGLIERSDRNYEKAIKCYINALKWDKENIQILRDLSMLQIHIRDVNAFKETRYTLLRLRPTHRVNWIAYAIAHHLLKEYDVAIKLMDQLRVMDTERNFEYSELLLYQNSILQEAGYVDEALKHLNDNEEFILDKLALLQYKASLFRQKGDKAHAVSLTRTLIMRNPDNPDYYKTLIELLELCPDEKDNKDTNESSNILHEFFDQMKCLYPRYDSPRRLELEYSKDDRFMVALDTYLRKAFVKGLPALFRNMKPLYKDQKKVTLIENMVSNYYKNLHSLEKFNENDSRPEKSPSTLMWVVHFLAQHYDYVGDYDKALQFINEAIEHTPTLLELLLVKAKIFKHCGDIQSACGALDECQSLDTADRYINCKCAKYLLRCDRVSEAVEMCSKFTREGQEVMENLNEMQCLWFLTETAAAYNRKGSLGEALKKCHQVLRHFDEIWEGQFDFHAYSMRKMTLRAYVQLLKLEDRIYEQRFFFKTAHLAIKIYLHIFDNPIKEEVVDESALSITELRKYRKKQEREAKKLEEQKKKEEEERQKQIQKQRKEDGGEPEGPFFAELIPSELEKPSDALKEAQAFLKPLLVYGEKCIQTHLLAFEVYHRRGKTLLMLRALNRARVLDTKNAQLHLCIVKFVLYLQQQKESNNCDETVQKVIDSCSQSDAFLPSPNQMSQFNNQFLSEHPHSLPHFVSGLTVRVLLKEETVDSVLSKLIESIPHKQATLQESVLLFEQMMNVSIFGTLEPTTLSKLREAFATKFPRSTCFQPSSSKSNGFLEEKAVASTAHSLHNGVMESHTESSLDDKLTNHESSDALVNHHVINGTAVV